MSRASVPSVNLMVFGPLISWISGALSSLHRRKGQRIVLLLNLTQRPPENMERRARTFHS